MEFSFSKLFMLLALFSSLSCVGCSAIKSYPDRPVQAEEQLKDMDWCFKYKEIQTPNPVGEDLTIWRDKVINCQIYAIDLNFTLFEQSIARESVSLNTGVDLAVIGLGGATAIVGNATTKSILGAISGGITGAKGSIDKDIFYSKTMPALLSQMEAQRKSQLVIIRNGLRNKADKYPLSEAIIDVENYFKAGSIPAALQGIVENSGSVADKATKDLKNLKPLAPASSEDVATITDVRKEFSRLYNLWNKAPDSDAGMNALAKAKGVLKELGINAPDKETFNKLDEEIRKAGPGSEQLKKIQEAFNKE